MSINSGVLHGGRLVEYYLYLDGYEQEYYLQLDCRERRLTLRVPHWTRLYNWLWRSRYARRNDA